MARSRSQPRLLQSEQQQQDFFLARNDAVSAVVVWALLEGLSFLVLPYFQLIKGESRLVLWLSITFPLGVIGAAAIGVSSWLVKWVQENIDRRDTNKSLWVILSQFLGWLGLIGISLPIIVVGLELWLLMLQGSPSGSSN